MLIVACADKVELRVLDCRIDVVVEFAAVAGGVEAVGSISYVSEGNGSFY